ncbi:MAG TPA: DUF1684 domain-containing protein [Gemmatimonadales bacterium]|nr:DUF1684 domain-containing protein [Gemmatimonadales bacterium]
MTLRWTGPIARLAAGLLLLPAALWSQAIPPELAAERASFSHWLATDPVSPRHAIARREIGSGLLLGPDTADIPLPGIARQQVTERDGRIVLAGADGERVLPRGRPVVLGAFTLLADGAPARTVLTVFQQSGGDEAAFYPYDPSLVFDGTMAPAERATRQRVLGIDGIEADAVEAGMVSLPVGGGKVRLRVLRVRTPGTEESELTIFFRDASNSAGTYPAGRFVELVPTAAGRYRLDFNRARNPYCAYNSVYPCPAPWRGNTIPVAVRVGERYLGGGLTTPTTGGDGR